MKVKICGLMHESEIEFANELEPDYIGFVFVPRSRHFIAPERAQSLKSRLRKKIQVVGVFANESLETVGSCADAVQLDAVQLHGAENEEYICALRECIRGRIIKAFRIAGPHDADLATRSSADYVLLDGGAGDGKPFDWSLAASVHREYFLAGGLTPENVEAAVAVSPTPWALDVSTGVEVNGVKDYRKMRQFIEAVREHGRRFGQ